MSDSSLVIIQGTVGLYTVATRCHRCFAVTLKYTEDSSLKILPHSLPTMCSLGYRGRINLVMTASKYIFYVTLSNTTYEHKSDMAGHLVSHIFPCVSFITNN